MRLVGDDALPVAGGTVRYGRLVEARSGADGLARLEGLPLAPLDLRGTADRHLEGRARGNPPFPPVVELTLPRAFTIEGRIVGGDRQPLAGAWLKIVEGSHSLHPTVEESGRFLLDLSPGAKVHLEAGAPGAVSERWPVVPGAAGEWRDLGDLVLGRGLEVTGRVVAADTGEPLAGARIWAPRPGPYGPGIAWIFGDLVEAVSGSDGHFRLSGLRAGPLLLRVDAPARARAHRDLLLDDEEPVDAGKIALAQGTTVHVVAAGLALADAERHTAEATVDLRGEWQALDLLRAPLREGRATVRHVPPGPVLVSVRTDLRVLCEQAVNVPAGEPEIEVECEADWPEVSGTVWSGSYRATGGSLTWSREQASRGRRPPVLVEVAPDGSFGTTELVAGRWTVTWNAPDGGLSPPLEVTIPAVERFEVALRFPGEGSPGGSSTTRGAGRPARVSRLLGGAFALSGADGAFVLSGIPPGPYAVQAREGDLASEIVEGCSRPTGPSRRSCWCWARGAGPSSRCGSRPPPGRRPRGRSSSSISPGRCGSSPPTRPARPRRELSRRCPSGCGWRRRPAGVVVRELGPLAGGARRLRATLGDARSSSVSRKRERRRARLLAPGGWDLGLLVQLLGTPLRLAPDAPLLLAGLRRELPDRTGAAAATVDLAAGDRRDHPRRLTRPQPAFRVGCRPPGGGVEVDDASIARRQTGQKDAVAGEHDAVGRGAVVAGRLVVGPFEGPDRAGVALGAEAGLLLVALAEEEGVHLRFGAPGLAQALPLGLDLAGAGVERLLLPGGGDRRARGEEVGPLERRRVEQGGDVRLPRLAPLGGRLVDRRRGVVLVGEGGEVMAELVDDDVRRPEAVGRHRRVLPEDPAAAVGAAVDDDHHDVVRRLRGEVAPGAVVEAEHVPLGAEGGVGGAGGERRWMPSEGGRCRSPRLRAERAR